MLVAAMRVGVRDGAAALGEGETLTGVCAQERVTRIRGGPTPGGVPDQALDLLLQRAGRSRADIRRLDVVGSDAAPIEGGDANLSDHLGHACTAYWTSPFAEAAGRGLRSRRAGRERLDRPRQQPDAAGSALGWSGIRRDCTPRFRALWASPAKPANSSSRLSPGSARMRETPASNNWSRSMGTRSSSPRRSNEPSRTRCRGARSRRSSSSVAGRCPSGASGRSPRRAPRAGARWPGGRCALRGRQPLLPLGHQHQASPGRAVSRCLRAGRSRRCRPACRPHPACPGGLAGTGVAVPRPVVLAGRNQGGAGQLQAALLLGDRRQLRLDCRRGPVARAGWSAGSTMRWSGDRARLAREASWRARVRPTCSRT